MAKISARGATKIATWKRDEARLVLCSDGRLLGKYLAGDGYTVRARKATLTAAAAYAAKLGYREVK